MATTPDPDIQKLQAEILILQNNYTLVAKLIDKIDVTISKFTEVSANLDKVLSVHENRLNNQEQINNSLIQLLESMRDMRENDMVKIYSELKEIRKENEAQFDEARIERSKIVDRVTALENWKWMVIGISTAVTTLGTIAVNVVLKLI